MRRSLASAYGCRVPAAQRSSALRRTRDAGTITAMTAGALGAFVAVSMLVFGGSAVLRARSDAFGHAASAARAAAQALDEDALSRGEIEIDPLAAEEAAQQYLVAVAAEGTVSIVGTDVIVTVVDSVEIPHLGHVVPIDATATVSAVKGATP